MTRLTLPRARPQPPGGMRATRAAQELIGQELVAVRGEMNRVDAKCSTLAALTGAAAAYTGSLAGHGPLAARTTAAAASLAFAGAVLVLLLAVLRPRLAGGIGFCRWAVMTTEAIAGQAENAGTPHGRRREAQQAPEALRVLSVITVGKYRRLRIAVDLAAAGVVLLAAGALAGAIA